ncbi:MAG: SufD family Fe-S cluster assembly protein, partial [Humibacter sp.]
MTITETEPTFIPVQTRSERFASTDVADFGAVTGREATWRYTPVARIAQLFEPGLDGSRYDTELTTDGGVTAEWIGRDHALIGTAGTPEEKASANAWSSFDEALLVTVTGDAGEAVLLRSGLGENDRAAHTVVHALAGSTATVVLRNTGDASLTENVEIVLEQGAQLTLVSVQEWTDASRHVSTHFASVGRDARLKHVTVSLGGGFIRLN